MIFRNFEQKMIKIINESGLPIDAIYFIMKNLIQEIEQEYNAYCRIEEAEIAQQSVEPDGDNEESGSKEDEPVSAN